MPNPVIPIPALSADSLVVSWTVDREPTLGSVTVTIAVISSEADTPLTSDTTYACTTLAVDELSGSRWRVTASTPTIGGTTSSATVKKAAGDWGLWQKFTHAGWVDEPWRRAVTLRITD